jgi:hypothetical protein
MPFNDAGMLKQLGIISKLFMEAMAENIRSKRAPRKIIEHTSATSPKKEGNKYSVEIVIDTSEDAAPMAGAFEWGSGEHGEEGDRYLIPGAPWLIIPRERWPDFEPPERDPILMRSVMHPGVEARPYIKPTIMETRDKFRDILGKEFKAMILADTKKVEVISVKK